MKIIIKNAGGNVTADSLAVVFSTYGKVSSSVLYAEEKAVLNTMTAFVTMPNENEARRAITRLNGCFVDGRPLVVELKSEWAVPLVYLCYKQARRFLLKGTSFFSLKD